MKKVTLLAAAGLAVTMMVGGTWAVWTQELKVGNEFQTAYYHTEVQEHFQSPENWEPGIETEKQVWLSNTGEIPVLVKAVISQNWVRRENVWAVIEAGEGEYVKTAVSPKAGQRYPSLTVSGDKDDRWEFAAVLNFNKEETVMFKQHGGEEQQNLKNPSESDIWGIPVVDSVEEARGKWLLTNEMPDQEGNLTFYYIGAVEPGTKTPLLLKSVTMNPKAQASVLKRVISFRKEKDGKYRQVESDVINPDYGFDSARYTLNVSMTTVQAVKEAVEEVLGSQKEGAEKTVVTYLAEHIADSGINRRTEESKKLIFSEKNGELMYTVQGAGSGTEDGSWFMSFMKMVPGEIYTDQMVIENISQKNFDVSMQIIPRSQDDNAKDELLNRIRMKIFYNDQNIYDGTAMGNVDSRANMMQKERPLGYYASGESGKIRVELQLDPDISLDEEEYGKYGDLLTKIDWKFMAQERPELYSLAKRRTSARYPAAAPQENWEAFGIPDGTVPMAGPVAGKENVLTLGPDRAVPLTIVPETGDRQPAVWIVMAMIVSGCIFVYLCIRRLEKKNDEQIER